MKYTKYFAQLIRENGVPQLPYDQYRTFLSIIHFEAKLKVYKTNDKGHQYSGRIYAITNILDQLTGKLEPRDLVEKWINGDSISKTKTIDDYVPWNDHDPYLTPKPRHDQNDFKTRSRRY